MDVVRSLAVACEPGDLFPYIESLDAYPPWMTLIAAVEHAAGADAAWTVELQARVGPFARSKRLRMERTEVEPDRLAVFERREIDGREHSPWILRARLRPLDDGTELTMELHYGGGLWVEGALSRVLDDHIRRSSDALRALVEGARADEPS